MRLVTVLNKCCRFKFFVFKKVKFSDREKRYNAWGLIYKTINSKGLNYTYPFRMIKKSIMLVTDALCSMHFSCQPHRRNLSHYNLIRLRKRQHCRSCNHSCGHCSNLHNRLRKRHYPRMRYHQLYTQLRSNPYR